MGGSQQYVGELLIVQMRRSSAAHARLGITVTKKYGDAHQRNRFKRVVREAFRLSPALRSASLDFLIRPRSLAKSASMHQVQQEFQRHLESYLASR